MLIRYPGSKAKLRGEIMRLMPDCLRLELFKHDSPLEYREPFFGSGAFGLEILRDLPSDRIIWLNDMDIGIVSLWQSVVREHRSLIDKVQKFKPSSDAFYRFKEADDSPSGNIVEDGFRKLALHQISFSGLGYMAGGPLGGRNSENASYPPDCRWRPGKLMSRIKKLNDRLSRFKSLNITHGDFAELVESAPADCFLYCDPPYYEKGPQLYKHSMSDDDHQRLATAMHRTKARLWAVSYDDHPRVRGMYDWATIDELDITYTTATAQGGARPKNCEVLIRP